MRTTFEHGNWLFELIEQWSQFFEPCNWYTFHPIHFEIEDDRIMGGFEIVVIVLGVGFRWRWNHSETEQSAEIARRVAEIKDTLGVTPQ